MATQLLTLHTEHDFYIFLETLANRYYQTVHDKLVYAFGFEVLVDGRRQTIYTNHRIRVEVNLQIDHPTKPVESILFKGYEPGIPEEANALHPLAAGFVAELIDRGHVLPRVNDKNYLEALDKALIALDGLLKFNTL